MNTEDRVGVSGDASAVENVLFGVIGAFLFSLVGGAMYILLSRIGFIAALSGLVGVVCAIKGYAFFAKKESKRGVIISVVIAALVLVIAWYLGFCLDMVDAYEMWYQEGEVDYVPSFFEYIPFGFVDLTVNPLYFVDLLLSLVLGAFGCWSYVANRLKQQRAAAEAGTEMGAEPPFDVAADAAASADGPAADPFAQTVWDETPSEEQPSEAGSQDSERP